MRWERHTGSRVGKGFALQESGVTLSFSRGDRWNFLMARADREDRRGGRTGDGGKMERL